MPVSVFIVVVVVATTVVAPVVAVAIDAALVPIFAVHLVTRTF